MFLLDREYYSSEELAEMLGVTTRTIRNYLKEQKIKGYKIGGKWKFSRDDIEEYIRKQTNELLNVEELQEQGLDTCKVVLNFNMEREQQTTFFNEVTKIYNDYEKQNGIGTHCYLTCLSVNEYLAKITIAGEFHHTINLINIVKSMKK